MVKKCGSSTCEFCEPPQLPSDTFSTLSGPMPGTDTSVSVTCTDQLQKQSKKTLPFASSLRHVKNVDMMLECEHCGSWRILYCEQKLTKKERKTWSKH